MHKNKESLRRLRQAQGFSLVGTAIALLLLVALATSGSMLYSDYKQDQVAQGRGKQIGIGLAQLDKFARKYQTQLTAGQAIAGVANPYSPTTAELQALGFAAAGFADSSQPGGAIAFQIAREPAGCAASKCILSLKVVTSRSVTINEIVSAPFAQRIAGHVPDGAGWSNLATDATKLAKNGTTIPNPLGSTPAIVAAVAWLGNNQSSQTVPPVTYNYLVLSCGTGYTGQIDQQQSVTTDKWGNVTTGAWTTYSNTCQLAPPTPTGSYTETTTDSCPSGYSGYTQLSRTCTNYSDGSTTCGGWATTGDYCSSPPPSGPQYCANGATNYPTCTFPPPDPVSCPNGASNYPACTFPAPEPERCPNGASNYPTCTFPPPEPERCLNGASNYPACTFPPPEPISCPAGVEFSCSYENNAMYRYSTTYSGPNCTPKTVVDIFPVWDYCPDPTAEP